MDSGILAGVVAETSAPSGYQGVTVTSSFFPCPLYRSQHRENVKKTQGIEMNWVSGTLPSLYASFGI